MSTAFYKSSSPRLLKSFFSKTKQKSIEIWNTSCIVTNFGKQQKLTACNTLINPANPELSGISNFPYFPVGGPVPKMKPESMHADWQPLGYVSNWGGMEVGSGMLFPVSVVDGLVHQLGGIKLKLQCKLISSIRGCPTGTAVSTSHADEALQKHYDYIIHTAPPFYDHDENPIDMLKRCYAASFDLAFQKSNVTKVACPLIGAGARGFPTEESIDIAASESLKWIKEDGITIASKKKQSIMFGIPDVKTAEKMVEAIERSSF